MKVSAILPLMAVLRPSQNMNSIMPDFPRFPNRGLKVGSARNDQGILMYADKGPCHTDCVG